MKKFIFLFFTINTLLYSQVFQIVDIDSSAYPLLKARFLVIDSEGKQVTNISKSDFLIIENGEPVAIQNLKCPSAEPAQPISSVLVMDASGSMRGNNLMVAKEAAKAWIKALDLTTSECAITAFDDKNYMIQDFSTQKELLLEKTNSLFASGGTNYDAALIDTMAGGLQITKNAKYKPIIVFLTDGQPSNRPKIEEIINEANSQGATIYVVTINMSCLEIIKDIAKQTGGLWFENIRSESEAKQIYQLLLNIAQGSMPCEVEWVANKYCIPSKVDVAITYLPLDIKQNFHFLPKNEFIMKLQFEPKSIKITDPLPSTIIDTVVKVTARNAVFKVTNITASNPYFSITPTYFELLENESIELNIRYTAMDSNFYYNKFVFENDVCPTNFYMSAGWQGKHVGEITIKLLHPNGKEIFIAGEDTIITWDGIMPEDKVKLEYSTDDGVSWNLITNSADSLKYHWKIPDLESRQCLARVTAQSSFKDCDNPDADICGKVWMSCNLNVDRYRNGDIIPEVRDPEEWKNLQTGAWCYYNNDSSLGNQFGKLYNWYAVNDPRGLAPEGWHIPNIDEWIELSDCLGGQDVAGGKIKTLGNIEDSTGVWYKPNVDASNESGFSGLPGGWRGSYSNFYMMGFNALWWTSKEFNSKEASAFRIISLDGKVHFVDNEKFYGFSVRCVRD